ncbi:uncharacterized protein UTRI_05102_B [Ustilago trichophora]|uniref:Uncharacterized protein n=1 Tax=Ustilago trichophora TaxID=86804 RepID=A0A5C3EEB9_9BASI|nr:uncharacterized protein UTRI_05102_B [Ustilago trichophora]
MTNTSALSGGPTSWIGNLTTTGTTSASWFSLSSLTSVKAIPLYLLLGLWLVQRLPSLLERFFTPTGTASTSAWVVPAETRHARFLPVESQHAFRYNILYLALRLDKLETRKLDTGHAFAWKGGMLMPEFVDQDALAKKKNVTPATIAKTSEGSKEEWEAKMRAAERIERRKLEEKRSRNERYTWSLTGLHPSAYLRTHLPTSTTAEGLTEEKGKWIGGSILLKLAYELRERGHLSVGPQDSDTTIASTGKDWRHELGQVWTVTMPSIAGITGINPLTVHYCYRPHNFNSAEAKVHDNDKRGDFWLVVLEVHNTFSERHIYVLESGKNEDGDIDGKSERRGGYDHQWTFPRSFHVSPFNDRGGFYRLFLKEPFTKTAEASTFTLGVRLLLLVESESTTQDSSPKLVKKLMATLDSISVTPQKRVYVGRCVRPLSPATLYAALLRQPVDLFLTLFRILYEAAKLHFAKRLDAFGRPDMVQLSEPCHATFDGVGLPPPVNKIQPHRQDKTRSAGEGSVGLVYPEPGWTEKIAKDYVASLLTKRVKKLEEKGESWKVDVESTDPADSGIHIGSDQVGKARELKLYTRSYGVYVDLMTHNPARLALLLGSIIGRRWGVSSLVEFDDFFPPPTLLASQGVTRRHFEFLLDPISDRKAALTTLAKFGISTDAKAKKQEQGGWKVGLALWIGYISAVAEKKLFGWLGARYVKGTEPWLELVRALHYLEGLQSEKETDETLNQWDTRLGSVYHPYAS